MIFTGYVCFMGDLYPFDLIHVLYNFDLSSPCHAKLASLRLKRVPDLFFKSRKNDLD